MASFGQAEIDRQRGEWDRLQEADRVGRDRRRVDRTRRDKELAHAATPETMRKLDRPVIDRLVEQGKFDETQRRVATEIAKIWHDITASLFPRAATLDRGAGGGGVTGFVPNIFTCGYQDRYLPWTREMERCDFRAGRTRLDIVLMLVVDNYGPKQIEEMVGSDSRTVLASIRQALHRYAEIAGWVEMRGLPLLAANLPDSEFAA